MPSSVTIHRAKPLKSLNPVLCGMGYSTPFTSATSNCVAIRFTKSARSTPSQWAKSSHSLSGFSSSAAAMDSSAPASVIAERDSALNRPDGA